MNRFRLGWRIALTMLSIVPASSRAMCPATEYSGVWRTPTGDEALPNG